MILVMKTNLTSSWNWNPFFVKQASQILHWKRFFPDVQYTGIDIIDGENVDLVADAHRLSEYFDKESFDLVLSFAVFEHLAMPWVVAEEISKVLKIGGHVAIETHFSYCSICIAVPEKCCSLLNLKSSHTDRNDGAP